MKNIAIFLFSLSSLSSGAQQISYSKPVNDYVRQYDIIGKLNNHIFIYENIRSKHLISIYDNQMNLKENVRLKFLPSNVISVEFVSCADRVDIICQFQKRNVFYCMAMAIDENGKIIQEPIQLDTTHIKFLADLKLYHISSSEDRSKIVVYKIYKGDFYTGNGLFHFTTLLLDDHLQLIHKSQIQSFFENGKDLFSDFVVDNDGNFAFTKGTRLGSTDLFYQLVLVTKQPAKDNFKIYPLDLSGNLLDHVDLKADNLNHNYLINSLYYTKRNGHKEGPYTAIWSKQTDSVVATNFFSFTGASSDMTGSQTDETNNLDYYYLRNVILTKDGGFVVTMEDLTVHGGYILPWNVPENQIFSSAAYVFSGNKFLASSFYKNVVILYFDSNAHLRWSSEIQKSQSGAYPQSFTVVNTGNKIHFLFNEIVRQIPVMNEEALTSDGSLSNKTPLANLDLRYELITSLGKQVSSDEMIFPCLHRSDLCFAKVEYKQ